MGLYELIDMGVWNEKTKQHLIAANGSVQYMQGVPDEFKLRYKTVWEISQKVLIDMSADRGAFIDQSQSFNVHMRAATYQKLTSMHFYGWKKGLKTGQYYLRTQAAVDAIKFTVDANAAKIATESKDKSAEAKLIEGFQKSGPKNT